MFQPLPPQLESKGPVLHKLLEAFQWASQVYAVGVGASDLQPGSLLVQEYRQVRGLADFLQSCALVAWCPEDSCLVLSYKGSHELFERVVHDDRALAELAPPFYLRHLQDNGARVISLFQASFERLHSGVVAAVRELLGDQQPRRVLVCGYCAGGGLAAIAAPWAALAFPSADVRAITFGAPRVGNSEFQRLFSWLVGLSYRAVYRFDPIPHKPRPGALLSLQLTAVGSDLFFDGKTAAQMKMPLRFSLKGDLSDHMMARYISGAQAAGTTVPDLPKTPLCFRCLVDPAALSSPDHPDPQLQAALDDRGDCTGRCACPAAIAAAAAMQAGAARAAPLPEGNAAAAAAAAIAEAGAAAAASQGVGIGPAGAYAAAPKTLPVAPDVRRAQGSPGKLSPSSTHSLAVSTDGSKLQRASDEVAPAQLPKAPAAGQRGTPPGSRGAFCGGWLCRGPVLVGTKGLQGMLTGGGSSGGGGKGASSKRSAAGTAGHKVQQASALTVEEFWGDLMVQVSRLQSTYLQWSAAISGGSPLDDPPRLDAASLACYGAGGQAAPAVVSCPCRLPQSQPPAGGPTKAQSGLAQGETAAAQAGLRPGSKGGTDGGHTAGDGGAPWEGEARSGPGSGKEGGWADQLPQAASGAGDLDAYLPEWLREADSLDDVLKALSVGRLHRAAQLAFASYFPSREFEQLGGLEGAPVVLVEDTVTDAQAYVAWRPGGTAVFVFRGTANRLDAAADLQFWRRQVEFLPQSFPGCKAHLGFLKQFVSLTSASDPGRHIGAALGTLSGGRAPSRVLCIGHSLGGALATLGATWAALQWPGADVRCITFGSPRVGNRKFVRAFSTLVGTRLRAVHGADPIPSVPPPFRYSHIEPSLHFKGATLHLWKELWPRHLMFSVTDHFMAKYLASLNAVLGRGGVMAAAVTAADVLVHGGMVAQAVAAAAAENASPAAGAALEDSASAHASSAAAASAAAAAAAAAAATSALSSPAAGSGQKEQQTKKQAEEEESAASDGGGSAGGIPGPADEGQVLQEGPAATAWAALPEGKELESQEKDCALQQVEGILAQAPLVRLLCSAGG